MAPLLDLDRTPEGERRRTEYLKLLDEALRSVGDPVRAAAVEASVASTEELQLEEEDDDGPPAYRVDFMVMLDYALLAAVTPTGQELRWCLMRAGDTLAYLEDEGVVLDGAALDTKLLRLIGDLENDPVVTPARLRILQKELEPNRQILRATLNVHLDPTPSSTNGSPTAGGFDEGGPGDIPSRRNRAPRPAASGASYSLRMPSLYVAVNDRRLGSSEGRLIGRFSRELVGRSAAVRVNVIKPVLAPRGRDDVLPRCLTTA